MVVFTMAVSEFGVPKVIGGNYSVLAIDIYKQVIGQQNFQMGAVVGLVLLVPAVVAFVHRPQVRQPAAGAADRAQRALRAAARARWRDALLLAFVLLMSAVLLLVMGMAVFGSFVKVWPYNLSFTLNHYIYGFERGRRRSRLLQQPGDGGLVRRVRRGGDLRRRLLAGEDRHREVARLLAAAADRSCRR